LEGVDSVNRLLLRLEVDYLAVVVLVRHRLLEEEVNLV
jgi:hypothetical protein